MTRSLSLIDRSLSDLSDYAHREQMNSKVLDFSHWLQYFLFHSEVKAITKGAIVRHEIENGIFLRFDEDMRRRALVNVIKNAINACENRYSPHLLLAASRDKSSVAIRIEDNGKGLPTELGEHIFEPLVIGSQFGLGLGLSVVRDIMQLHSGRLEIRNRTDAKGVMVCLYLPYDEKTLPSKLYTPRESKTHD